ncbi:hypothetical protein C0583_00470 [Candidatus Parcubacteria bacterium]|nr:MAG: hypothetical protein C0583_00470 [Candidatus Parcubacteria bacterium]
MENNTLIPGIILLIFGLVFFYNNHKIAKGAAKFYQKIYQEKNLLVIFKIVGVILVIGGIILIFF